MWRKAWFSWWGHIAFYLQQPKLGIYSVAKTAVHTLVKVLAGELVYRGTLIVGVALGSMHCRRRGNEK